MITLPKTALGLDTVDLGVATVVVDTRSMQLAPPTTEEGEDR